MFPISVQKGGMYASNLQLLRIIRHWHLWIISAALNACWNWGAITLYLDWCVKLQSSNYQVSSLATVDMSFCVFCVTIVVNSLGRRNLSLYQSTSSYQCAFVSVQPMAVPLFQWQWYAGNCHVSPTPLNCAARAQTSSWSRAPTTAAQMTRSATQILRRWRTRDATCLMHTRSCHSGQYVYAVVRMNVVESASARETHVLECLPEVSH